MSGLFDSYTRDYKDHEAQVTEIIKSLQEGIARQKAHAADATRVYSPPPATGPLSRAQQLSAAQQLVSLMRENATSMGYEANDLPPAARPEAKAAAEKCKQEATRLEQQVAALRPQCTAADRADLLGYTGGGDMMDEADDGTKAMRLMSLETTEKVQQGTKTLKKAEAYLYQANELGRESLGTLRTQTEQLQRIHETTHDVDAEVSEARQIIKQMQRTAIKHKIWLFGIIFMLFAFISLIIYIKVK